MITEGISNNGLQLVRRGEAKSADSSRYDASPGEAVDNLNTSRGGNPPSGALEATDTIDLSQKTDADSKMAGLSHEAQKDTESVIKKMVQEMNQKFDRSGLHLRFGKDQESGLDFFQLYDKKNGDVVKQYPPEEMLDMVAQLRNMAGIIFNENV